MIDKKVEQTIKLLDKALTLLKARTASDEEAKLITLLCSHIKR